MGAPGDHEGPGLPAGQHDAEVRSRGGRAEARRGDPAAGARRRTCRARSGPARASSADASNCPDSSRVGTAIIDSPLQAAPVRGPVYIAFNTDNPTGLPGLMVILPPPVGRPARRRRRDRRRSGTKNTFASNPDLPVRSFTLEFEGGRPDSALTLNQDLCGDSTDRTMEVHLVAHNGKELSFEQELATPGCDPRASFTLRRNGRRATLVARLRATRVGPGITQFALKLPKTLSRGKVRPFVLADGQPRARHPQAAGDDAVPGRGPLGNGGLARPAHRPPPAPHNRPEPDHDRHARPHDEGEEARTSPRQDPEGSAARPASRYPRPPRLGGRLMARRQPLELVIGVRVPAPQ